MCALLSGSTAAIYPLSTTPQAEVADPAEAGEQVPFRGSLDGVVTRSHARARSVAPVLVEGTGHASHLGRFTFYLHGISWTSRRGPATGTYTVHGGQRRHADRRT